jgi:hypothetical protein
VAHETELGLSTLHAKATVHVNEVSLDAIRVVELLKESSSAKDRWMDGWMDSMDEGWW